jgi:hypothetical protein
MTGYKGLYRIGDIRVGGTTDVQVESPEGHSQPMAVGEYVSKGIEPPFETLPWGGEPYLYPLPETPEAIARGCICKVSRDAAGKKMLAAGGEELYTIDERCPVHGWLSKVRLRSVTPQR